MFLFLKRLGCSMLTGCALAWVIACMRWLYTDKGAVRLQHDSTYLFLGWLGAIWLCLVLYAAISVWLDHDNKA